MSKTSDKRILFVCLRYRNVFFDSVIGLYNNFNEYIYTKR